MDEYGLPWEASAYLLAQLHSHWHYPTARDVVWWWRVHLAIPEESQENVRHLAVPFIQREWSNYVMGRSLDFFGLQEWLAYKPWQNKANYLAYHEGTENGFIFPLGDGPEPDGLSEKQANLPACPELLPHQQSRLRQHFQETKEQPYDAIKNGLDIWN